MIVFRDGNGTQTIIMGGRAYDWGHNPNSLYANGWGWFAGDDRIFGCLKDRAINMSIRHSEVLNGPSFFISAKDVQTEGW